MSETVVIDSIAPTFAYLIVLGGPRRGVVYQMREPRTQIGRSGNDNDIVLGDDPAISGRHANVRKEKDGEYYLVDLDSTNGSKVNGQRITLQQLRHDDRVTLGKTDLVFKRLA
jgi:pSer/pThr/pTyr-binding forkhead associated (FHA) protein